MNKHNKNVRFTLEQIKEIEYIVSQYMGGRVGKYIHDYEDFCNYMNSCRSAVEFGIGVYPNDCNKCEGDPAKVPGGSRCDECHSVVGTQPWGG